MKIIIMYLFFSFILFAQNGDWKQYLPEYKNIPDGLQINVIRIDQFDHKWFGTDGYSNINGTVGGIAKFDGKLWTQFTKNNSDLPDNNITAIAFDLEDNTWIGMRDSGLVILKNDVFSKIRGPLQFIEKGEVKNILTDQKGNVWVLFRLVICADGIYKSSALMKYDGENWVNFDLDSINVPEGEIHNIALDKDDNLYCGSQNEILKYDGSAWMHINGPGSDIRLIISYLKFDNNGLLWVGTNGFGSIPTLLIYENGLWKNTPDIYLSGEPSEIIFDHLGNTWVSSLYGGGGFNSEKGLAKYSNENWQYYNRENSAVLWNGINTLAIDSTGVLWCGTPFGACTFDGASWKYYRSSGGLPCETVNKVVVDNKNSKWMATDHFGLAKYDGNSWQTYNKSNSEIPFNDISDFEIDEKGNIWVATNGGGLGIFNGNTWIVYNQNNTGYPIDRLSKIKLDSQNKLWATTFGENTLLSFDGTKWQVFNSTNSILPESFNGNLGIDKNDNIWLGTNEGLFIYDGKDWINYNTSNSKLPNNWVQSFAFDSLGNSWVGTANGLVKIKDDNWEVFLPNNSEIGGWDINDITIDSGNNVWFGFFWGQGISKYDGNNWKHYNTVFDSSKGGIDALSIDLDEKGNLWIGTLYQGLIQFNEQKIVSVENNSKLIKNNNQDKISIYPNPFNTQTNINFILNATSDVSIKMFTITGEFVSLLTRGLYPAGKNTIQFNAKKLASGMYLCSFEITHVLQGQKQFYTKKIIYLK